MKRAINIRLEERTILLLNRLSKEFQMTKTEIIEKAIEHFSKESHHEKNHLMKFAGVLREKDADDMLEAIREDRNNKDFTLD